MKKYIEDSIDIWINNVIKAPYMIENKDFIIINNIIVPIIKNFLVLKLLIQEMVI